MPDDGRSVHEQRQGQHGQGYDGGRPDRDAQAAADPQPTYGDVAAGPRDRPEHGEDHAGHRDVAAATQGDDDQPHHPQGDTSDLDRGGPLAQHGHREDDGDHGLGLQDEGRQSGRHTESESGVEEAELADREEGAHEGEVAPRDVRPGHEGQGEQDDAEPDGDEEQGWHPGEALVDDDEVQPPDRHDESGSEGMAGRHTSSLDEMTMKVQRSFLRDSM